MPTRRIAILLTNEDDADFARAFPDDGRKLHARLSPLRPKWAWQVLPVTQGELPPDARSFDGYVITGSPASVNGPQAWLAPLLQFIRELHAQRVPTVGVCFGHQAMARALGGEVGPNPQGWSLGVGRTALAQTRPWMQPALPYFRLYAAHNEQVLRLPPGAVLLGGDAYCPVGAFEVAEHFLATEYHPELDHRFMTALIDHLADQLPAEVTERARQQIELPVDAAVFLEWMVRFLERPRAGSPSTPNPASPP